MSDKDVVIRVGLTKKIGQPNYGSFGAECSMEIGVDLGIIADPDRYTNLIRTAYQQCRDSIEEQLHAQAAKTATQSIHVPPPAPTPQQAPTSNGPSLFGKWILRQSESYGIPLPILTGQLYKQVQPNGGLTDYVQQGKAMAAVWDEHGDGAITLFGTWLDEAFDGME